MENFSAKDLGNMAINQVQGEVQAAIEIAQAENAKLHCQYREQEITIQSLKMKQLKVFGTKHFEAGHMNTAGMLYDPKFEQRLNVMRARKVDLEEELRQKREMLQHLHHKEVQLNQNTKIEKNRNAALTIRYRKKLQELETKRDELAKEFLDSTFD